MNFRRKFRQIAVLGQISISVIWKNMSLFFKVALWRICECWMLFTKKVQKFIFVGLWAHNIIFTNLHLRSYYFERHFHIWFFYKKISHVIFSLKSSDKRFNIQKKANYSYVKIFLDFGCIITLRLVESVRKYNVQLQW